MKMVMTLSASESGCIHYVKRAGAVLEPGCVIGKLQLDDPSRVQQVHACVTCAKCTTCYGFPFRSYRRFNGLVFPMSVSVSGWAVYRNITQCSVRGSQGREASQSLPQHSGSPSAHNEWLLSARALLQWQSEKTDYKQLLDNENTCNQWSPSSTL